MVAIDYTPTAERLIILPRRGKPEAPHKRMGLTLSQAVTGGQTGSDKRVRLIADVIVDAAGLRRVLHVQNHEASGREARLITASEVPMPQAEAHRDQLVDRLGYSDWPHLHRDLLQLEKDAKRRTPHGRIRCEIYALAE